MLFEFPGYQIMGKLCEKPVFNIPETVDVWELETHDDRLSSQHRYYADRRPNAGRRKPSWLNIANLSKRL